MALPATSVETAIYKMGVDSADYVRNADAAARAGDRAVESTERLAVAEEKLTRGRRTVSASQQAMLADIDRRVRAEQQLQQATAAANDNVEKGEGILSRYAGAVVRATGAVTGFASEHVGLTAAVYATATSVSQGSSVVGTIARVFSAAAIAARLFGSTLLAIGRNIGLAASAVAALPGTLSLLARGFLVFEAVSAIVTKASNDFEKLLTVSKEAESAGVSPEFLQRLKAGFEGIGLSADQATAAIKKASAALQDTFATINPIQEKLDVLGRYGLLGSGVGSSLADRFASGNSEQRQKVALEAIEKALAAGEKLAALDLANRVFGPDLAEALRRAEDPLAKMREHAEAMAKAKLLADADVARAKELDERLTAATKQISEFLGVTVSFSSLGEMLKSLWVLIAEKVASATKSIQDVLDRLDIKELFRRLNEWDSRRGATKGEKETGDLLAGTVSPKSVPVFARSDLGAMALPDQAQWHGFTTEMVTLGRATEFLAGAWDNVSTNTSRAAATTRDTLTSLQRYFIDQDKALALAKSEFENVHKTAIERAEAKAVIEATAMLQRDVERGTSDQYELVKDTTGEYRKIAVLSEEQVERTKRTARETEILNEKTKQVRDAMRDIGEFGKSFASDFVSALVEGKSAMEAMAGAGKSLASSLMSRGFDRLFSQKTLDALRGGDPSQALAGASQAAGGALAGIGLQRGSLLLSAGGGALAGAGTGFLVGGPVGAGIGAAIGAGVGLLSGLFSQQAARQQRLAQIQQAMAQQAEAAARATAEALQRSNAFEDTLFASRQDTETLTGALAVFDRQAQRQREAEARAGGQAMIALEANIAEGRLGIIKDFEERVKNAEEDIRRTLNANAGKSYLNEIGDVVKRRAELLKQGASQGLVDEYFASEARRIIESSDMVAGSLDDLILRFPELAGVIDSLGGVMSATARNIQAYLDELKGGSGSTLAPMDRLGSAREAFERQFAMAQGGDSGALSSITQYASRVLEASRSVYASSSGYQQDFASITGRLAGLAGLPGGQATYGTDALTAALTGGPMAGLAAPSGISAIASLAPAANDNAVGLSLLRGDLGTLNDTVHADLGNIALIVERVGTQGSQDIVVAIHELKDEIVKLKRRRTLDAEDPRLKTPQVFYGGIGA